MKCRSFRALRGRGELNLDEDYFRERYNESSSFSNDLMKRKSYRAWRGRGKLNADEDYFREQYNELSSFSNNLMKRRSFRASRWRGGGTEFRQGLRVENGTTNRLLSLMI